jgi:hypothetical protein
VTYAQRILDLTRRLQRGEITLSPQSREFCERVTRRANQIAASITDTNRRLDAIAADAARAVKGKRP